MEKNVLWLPVSISPHWDTIMYPGGNTSYLYMIETVKSENGSQIILQLARTPSSKSGTTKLLSWELQSAG